MTKNLFNSCGLGFFFFYTFFSFKFSFSWANLLLLLSSWIFMLMVLSWFPSSNFYYLLLITILFLLLVLTFTSSSLISFYIFFESSLIPTMLLILGWGYQPERLPSSLYFLFYTLIASLPLLFILLGMNWEYQSLYTLFLPGTSDQVFHLFIISAFLVKLPMYFVHIWLPKAHVEAPVTGSMALAAVLLKLGGYGLFLIQPLMQGTSLLFVILIAVWGGVLSCVLSLRQTDVKSLIAYSSVAHMAFVIAGMLIFNFYGNYGSLVMMLAHGLCSSGLFYLSFLIYSCMGSRSFLITRGILVISPFMTLWWFLLIVFNMGVPPSFNLISELMIFISMASSSILILMLVGLISFFSACYCLYLYSSSSHGELLYLNGSSSFPLNESLVSSLHFLPLIILTTL
nr:NADH dehydrogenase subunit 4 [Branchinecta gaini]